MTFLEQLVDRSISELNPQDLGRSLFLFPNKRAILFFYRALQEHRHRPDPLLVPELDTLADWVLRSCGLQAASWETLLLTLYRNYRDLTGSSALPFELFHPHTRAIVDDLIEIDRGRLTPSEIRTLAERAKSSDNQCSPYSALLDLLPDLHRKFNRSLIDQKLAHDALALRQLLEHPEYIEKALPAYPAVYVCGFYPIDQAEIELFEKLSRLPQVRLVWDADRYFIDQPDQEAGLLFKDPRLFPDPTLVSAEEIRSQPRTITLIETQGNIDQAKIMASVLQDLADQADEPAEQTAILLPREALLLPLLSAIPQKFAKINITMGYPLAQSLPVSLLHCLQDLQSQLDDDNASVPFQPLYRLLMHPQWSAFLTPETLDGLQRAQAEQSRTIDRHQAEQMIMPLENLLLPAKKPSALFSQILDLLDSLRESLTVHESSGQPLPKLELLFQLRRQVLAAARIASAPDITISVKTAWLLLWECLEQAAIPFSGEPLQGLQIMGLLESRCLDFSNLIILSCNEGVFPPGRSAFSLIPGEVRKQFKLSGYREQDARAAYHFYRLLKRSRRVWLIYDGSGSGDSGNEASRFIKQIEHELSVNCPLTRLQRRPLVHIPPPAGRPLWSVPNHEGLRRRWQEMPFSASAINTYLNCPLQFFFRYGLNIAEKTRESSAADPRGIGLIAHKCLEELYRPYLGRNIDRAAIENMLTRVSAMVTETSRRQYPGLDTDSGRPYLESYILNELLQRLLSAQSEQSAYRLEGIEKRINGRISLGDGTSFRLTGSIDRIDRLADGWRIVDYKSGAVKAADLNIGAMPESMTEDSPFHSQKIAWQLLFYQHLYCRDCGLKPDQVDCVLLPLRNPDDGFLGFKSSADPTRSFDRFQRLLLEFFSQLNDPEYIFNQTGKPGNCQNCPYRDICHR